MTYSSIVPSQMSNHELQSICGDLQTAKNWGLKTFTVSLGNGLNYKVSTKDLKDYQEEFKTNCGGLTH